MRRKCSSNPAQLRLAFPPVLTPELTDCWRHLKASYPDPVVFVVESGHYISLDTDAETIAQLTGYAFEPASIRFMAVAFDEAATWFAALAHAGLPILICDPPDDPSRFVFT